MRKKERYEKVIAWFQDNVPVAEIPHFILSLLSIL